MKGVFTAATLCLLASLPAQVWAVATVEVRGNGGVSCGTWSADHSSKSTSEADKEWVLGFLSGVASATGQDVLNPSTSVDPGGLFAWIDKYCQAHPLNTLNNAAEALFNELAARRAGNAPGTPSK